LTSERRRTEYMPLADVLRAPRNPKRHRADLIGASMDRFGVVELPALDERTGRLVAGHGRLEDWQRRQDAGQQPPDGIELTPDGGDWLVPVTRGWASRSDTDAEGYLIVSNRTTELGGYDDDELAGILVDLRDSDDALLALTGYTDTDVDELAKAAGANENPWDYAGDVGVDDDEPEAPPADPVTQPGDVWILGRHRLLCGSATDPDDVNRALDGNTPTVVYTDPPYGINAVPKDGGVSRSKGFGNTGGKVIKARKYRQVIGDDTTATAVAAFALAVRAWPKAKQVWWGANHYAADAGMGNSSCWLVWNKQNGENDFADCELAWTNHPGAVRMLTHMWHGMLRASERGARFHPTQKPVALAVWATNLVDPKGTDGWVFDGFGGSGSTLLACETTARRAALIEMDPGYCDVICRRYQEATGDTPVREADGEHVDFLTEDAD
jgi:16S rRNA G966 N2-methylase RsmD